MVKSVSVEFELVFYWRSLPRRYIQSDVRRRKHSYVAPAPHCPTTSLPNVYFPTSTASFPSMSENRLCDRCQEILSSGEDVNEVENDHHVSSETLLQAAERGCYICKWILRYVRWSPARGSYDVPIHHTLYTWDKSKEVPQFKIRVYATKHACHESVRFLLSESGIEGKFDVLYTFIP